MISFFDQRCSSCVSSESSFRCVPFSGIIGGSSFPKYIFASIVPSTRGKGGELGYREAFSSPAVLLKAECSLPEPI